MLDTAALTNIDFELIMVWNCEYCSSSRRILHFVSYTYNEDRSQLDFIPA